MKSSTNEGLDAKRDRRLLIDDPNKLTELYLFHTDTRFAPYKTNLHFYKNLLLRQFSFLGTEHITAHRTRKHVVIR